MLEPFYQMWTGPECLCPNSSGWWIKWTVMGEAVAQVCQEMAMVRLSLMGKGSLKSFEMEHSTNKFVTHRRSTWIFNFTMMKKRYTFNGNCAFNFCLFSRKQYAVWYSLNTGQWPQPWLPASHTITRVSHQGFPVWCVVSIIQICVYVFISHYIFKTFVRCLTHEWKTGSVLHGFASYGLMQVFWARLHKLSWVLMVGREVRLA